MMQPQVIVRLLPLASFVCTTIFVTTPEVPDGTVAVVVPAAAAPVVTANDVDVPVKVPPVLVAVIVNVPVFEIASEAFASTPLVNVALVPPEVSVPVDVRS